MQNKLKKYFCSPIVNAEMIVNSHLFDKDQQG